MNRVFKSIIVIDRNCRWFTLSINYRLLIDSQLISLDSQRVSLDFQLASTSRTPSNFTSREDLATQLARVTGNANFIKVTENDLSGCPAVKEFPFP